MYQHSSHFLHTTPEITNIWRTLRDEYRSTFLPTCWCCPQPKFHIELEETEYDVGYYKSTTRYPIMVVPACRIIRDEAIRRLVELKPHWKEKLTTREIPEPHSFYMYPNDIMQVVTK